MPVSPISPTQEQNVADMKELLAHTHTEEDVTNLSTDLSNKASTSHSHAEGDVTNLTTDLSGKASTSHTHTEANITNLVTDLAGKAASSHSHAPADVTGTAVITNDSRLSDARTPTTHDSTKHSVTYALPADITTHAALSTGVHGAGANSLIYSNDSRLTDARTPLAHTHPYEPIGLTTLANDTLTLALATNFNVKLTVRANRTLTTTVPAAGIRCSVLILTSGSSSYTITFGTGFKPTGTLATGTTTARIFVVNFISDGNSLYETGRTGAMVA
jgi:hypothetical protein